MRLTQGEVVVGVARGKRDRRADCGSTASCIFSLFRTVQLVLSS